MNTGSMVKLHCSFKGSLKFSTTSRIIRISHRSKNYPIRFLILFPVYLNLKMPDEWKVQLSSRLNL